MWCATLHNWVCTCTIKLPKSAPMNALRMETPGGKYEFLPIWHSVVTVFVFETASPCKELNCLQNNVATPNISLLQLNRHLLHWSKQSLLPTLKLTFCYHILCSQVLELVLYHRERRALDWYTFFRWNFAFIFVYRVIQPTSPCPMKRFSVIDWAVFGWEYLFCNLK